MQEIMEWGVADNQRRHVILQNAKERRMARQVLDQGSPYSISPATDR
jgi:hypothetical protein